jgi:hypothetical protein
MQRICQSAPWIEWRGADPLESAEAGTISLPSSKGAENAMTQQKKQKAAERARAQSVHREPTGEPTGEPTPQAPGLPVDPEDMPKGHPTSDRFQTEQAHDTGQGDAQDS